MSEENPRVSDESKLPARFEPGGPVDETEAKPDVPDMVVTEEEAIAIIRQQGGIELPPEAMSKLARVGVYVASVGILRMQRGKLVVRLAQAEAVMATIATAIQEGSLLKKQASGKNRRRLKVRDLKDLGSAYCDLFKATSEADRIMLESSGSKTAMSPKGGDDSPQVNRSFRQGETVQAPPGSGRTTIVAQHVHITEPPNPAKQ